MILALADDLTGALETGARFAQHGLRATVVTKSDLPEAVDAAVLVIDTETRHLSNHEAAAVVRKVAITANKFSPWLVYKKTDSTLRGNIAEEFRSVQDVFSRRPMIYVPAYPEMGRSVKNGELFVWGRRVHETEFADDRWNPVLDCRIEKVLGDVPVVVLDGESNDDVRAAVHRIMKESVPRLCAGPAALADALGESLNPGFVRKLNIKPVRRCLVVNGSLHPLSLAQMQAAEENGLFKDGWVKLDEQIEGTGTDRAKNAGETVRRMLRSSHFEALIVFGGDTAYGIHQSLAAGPLEPCGEIIPGVPVSIGAGLLWITKAGGFGAQDTLCTIHQRLI